MMGIAKVRVLCLPFFAHLQNLVRPSYSTFFFSFIAFRSSPFLSLSIFSSLGLLLFCSSLCVFFYASSTIPSLPDFLIFSCNSFLHLLFSLLPLLIIFDLSKYRFIFTRIHAFVRTTKRVHKQRRCNHHLEASTTRLRFDEAYQIAVNYGRPATTTRSNLRLLACVLGGKNLSYDLSENASTLVTGSITTDSMRLIKVTWLPVRLGISR